MVVHNTKPEKPLECKVRVIILQNGREIYPQRSPIKEVELAIADIKDVLEKRTKR
jgi:hypothetical protein